MTERALELAPRVFAAAQVQQGVDEEGGIVGIGRADALQHGEHRVVILPVEREQSAVDRRQRGGLEGLGAPGAVDFPQRGRKRLGFEGCARGEEGRTEPRRRATLERKLQGAPRRGMDQLRMRLMLQGLCVVTSELVRWVTPWSSTVVLPPSSEM